MTDAICLSFGEAFALDAGPCDIEAISRLAALPGDDPAHNAFWRPRVPVMLRPRLRGHACTAGAASIVKVWGRAGEWYAGATPRAQRAVCRADGDPARLFAALHGGPGSYRRVDGFWRSLGCAAKYLPVSARRVLAFVWSVREAAWFDEVPALRRAVEGRFVEAVADLLADHPPPYGDRRCGLGYAVGMPPVRYRLVSGPEEIDGVGAAVWQGDHWRAVVVRDEQAAQLSPARQ